MKQADQTEMDVLLSRRESASLCEPHRACIDFPERGLLPRLYTVSGAIVDLLGPMFWAALLVLFAEAEFSVR
jgi:hypothetical protein